MTVIAASKAKRMTYTVKKGPEDRMSATSVALIMHVKTAKLEPACERSRQTPYSGDATAGMPNNNSSDIRFRYSANREKADSPGPSSI